MPPSTPRRSVTGSTFISTALPPLKLQVSPTFRYLGKNAFELKGVAWVERHHFVEEYAGSIQRLIILQFEGFLEGMPYTYNYPLTNPVMLGGSTYNENTYYFSVSASIAADPGAETAHTRQFLADHGLALPDELMTSRYVRVVDEARRHELIIFYLEPIAATGLSLGEISQEGGVRPEHAALYAALTARARQYFTVLEG